MIGFADTWVLSMNDSIQFTILKGLKSQEEAFSLRDLCCHKAEFFTLLRDCKETHSGGMVQHVKDACAIASQLNQLWSNYPDASDSDLRVKGFIDVISETFVFGAGEQ